MTRLIAALLLLSTAAFAGDVFTRPPVPVDLMGYKAVLKDGLVVSTWRRYKRDDFAAYKVVKSSTKDPVYPEDKDFFTTGNIAELKAEDGRLSPGTWRYRMFITTIFGDRWMSPVVTIEIKPEDIKRAPPTAADFEP